MQNTSHLSTIIIVDDSKFFCELIKKRIEAELPYQVEYATSYKQARQLMATIDPNSLEAALLDFRLPDAENGEIIKLFVEYQVPSMVLISDITPDIRNFIWSHRVVDYVIKHDKYCVDHIVSSLQRIRKNKDIEILIVDDSKTNKAYLKKLLDVHGYQVLLQNQPTKALAQIESNPNIKMVITDYEMPELNGCELTKQLRMKYDKDELIIFGISARGDQIMAANFLKHGADDFVIRQTLLAEEFYLRINQHLTRLEQVEELRLVATTDHLTGINNRGNFLALSQNQYNKVIKHDSDFAFALIDIDNFKLVNDTYGHHVGDKVIQMVANTLSNSIRGSDVAGRFGGEEYAIFVNGLEEKNCNSFFNRLREAVEHTPVDVDGENIYVTISIGICTQKHAELKDLIHQADINLYNAKNKGRNTVSINQTDASIKTA